MKSPRSKCRINGLHVTEVTVEAMPNMQTKMNAVYALGEISKKPEGSLIVGTHGRCSAYTNNWSKTTLKLLDELLSSMEEDLLPRHFEEVTEMEDEDAGIKPGEDEESRQI